MSAKDGTFLVNGLPEGWVRVEVERVNLDVHVVEAPTYFQMGGSPPNLQAVDIIVEFPSAAISGRVTMRDGSPVKGATVKTDSSASRPGSVSDDQGRFRLEKLCSGLNVLQCSADGLPNRLCVVDGLKPGEERNEVRVVMDKKEELCIIRG
ncbi:MAG: carboxypeptidase-like regulatory domain-containing protein, partial [Planctomycetota bacterium]|nr:carboxypeptidase-like regulatory domain-containing protein [Planctomycetota bacterium]